MSDQQDQPKQDPLYKVEDAVKDAYRKTKTFVKEHPTLTIGVVGGLVGYKFGRKRGSKALGKEVKAALAQYATAASQYQQAFDAADTIVSETIGALELTSTALGDAHAFIRTMGMRPQFDQYLSDISRI